MFGRNKHGQLGTGDFTDRYASTAAASNACQHHRIPQLHPCWKVNCGQLSTHIQASNAIEESL